MPSVMQFARKEQYLHFLLTSGSALWVQFLGLLCFPHFVGHVIGRSEPFRFKRNVMMVVPPVGHGDNYSVVI